MMKLKHVLEVSYIIVVHSVVNIRCLTIFCGGQSTHAEFCLALKYGRGHCGRLVRVLDPYHENSRFELRLRHLLCKYVLLILDAQEDWACAQLLIPGHCKNERSSQDSLIVICIHIPYGFGYRMIFLFIRKVILGLVVDDY